MINETDIKKTMLRLVVRVAKRAKVKFGIGGGVAVAAHSYRRDTADVDAFFHYEDRQSVLRALRLVAGTTYTVEQLDASHWIAVPPGAEPDERIDLQFATGGPENSAIEMSKPGIYRGVTAPVFPVDWLIITKYLADRNDPKDWLDIYALHQRGAFDISSISKKLRLMGNAYDAFEFPQFMQRLVDLKKK